MATNTGGAGTSTSDLGRLVLRVTLGILILFHGVAKLQGGLDVVTGMVAKTGLPPQVAYLVLFGEVVAPVLLIVGAWTRLAALLVVVNMIVAVLLVHTSQLFTMSKSGGYGLELQAMYLFTALAVALLGAGAFSLGGTRGRFN
jgi:putative oxidoreductase